MKVLAKTKVVLRDFTTIRIGGLAKYFFIAQNPDDLCGIFNDFGNSFYILGGGSNLLINDSPIEKPVVKLAKPFDYIKEDGDFIEVGAATPFASLIQYCLKNKLGGLDPLAGIPATIGGMLAMNASSFGKEISSHLVKLEVFEQGEISRLHKKDISFGYRSSTLGGKVVLRAWFKFAAKDSSSGRLKEKVNYFLEKRKATQPFYSPAKPGVFTCGCVFKNPAGVSAGRLIEDCGFGGIKHNDAMVSLKHANFIINLGKATCNDVDYLIGKVKEKVYSKHRVILEEEIVRWKI